MTDAITRERWSAAGRALVAKMLGELTYEEVLTAAPSGDGEWTVTLPAATYTFRARQRSYGWLRVEPGSARRSLPGAAPVVADDPNQLLLDLHEQAGIDQLIAGHLYREIAATQTADVLLAARAGRRTAAELVTADYAVIEGEMDGHPWLVPNKGRLGFGLADTLRYAPEQAVPQRLPWLAVRRDRGTFHGVAGLTHADLVARELGPETMSRFTTVLAGTGAPPDDYFWFPVHPWQWDHIVVPLFAADLAAGDIVLLGDAPSHYLPQQSIRTFSNVDDTGKFSVKLPLSILNTLVWRGLPVERTVAAPAVTAFIHGLAAADPFLAEETRPVLLGEVASVAVEHPGYVAMPGAAYQYDELLGAIWREPVAPYLDAGERAMTMAALLHTDPAGDSVAAALVAASGLPADEWTGRLMHALLPPLLHLLYKYGVVFSPHGENAILVHADGVPTRLAVKDFVDDVNLTDQPLPELDALLAAAPPEVGAVLLREPPDWICQFLWAALFVGHFRYLADVLEVHCGLPEERFWAITRGEILAYQERFGGLADRFALFDLLRPVFPRIALNRNRLYLDGYADRPERPHAAVHGTVRNPLAG